MYMPGSGTKTLQVIKFEPDSKITGLTAALINIVVFLLQTSLLKAARVSHRVYIRPWLDDVIDDIKQDQAAEPGGRGAVASPTCRQGGQTVSNAPPHHFADLVE